MRKANPLLKNNPFKPEKHTGYPDRHRNGFHAGMDRKDDLFSMRTETVPDTAETAG